MATLLTYTVSPYIPFIKILSANINQDKIDIKNRINWAGGTSATTGLGDDNIQSIAASGGGLTRATKLKLGTAYAVLINSVTGAMSELVTAANQTVYTNSSGVPTAGVLPFIAGGTGIAIDPTTHQPGDVLQVDPTSTTLVLAPPTASPSTLRVYNFLTFS